MKYVALLGAIIIGFTQGFTSKSVLLIIFVLWTIPLNYFRTKFRMIVYETSDWKIALRPIFWKEIKALVGNIYPKNLSYIRMRNFYRFYLIIFFILYLIWRYI